MTTDIADKQRSSTVVHLPNGQFAPGNPGRPRGSKNRISNEALAAVKDMKDDAIQQLREKIAAGEWTAILFVLERILPRGRAIELDGTSPNEIADQLANGQLTTTEARDVAVALAKLAEIGELATIKERLEELETAIADQRR